MSRERNAMDWNTDRPNTIEVPDGAAKIAVYPVVEMLRVPDGKLHKATLEPKLDAAHKVVIPVPDDATEVVIDGAGIEIPERLRITGVRAFYREASAPIGERGAGYMRPRWMPLAEWEIPAGRERADADLEALKAED
jgi:hypothetical protein